MTKEQEEELKVVFTEASLRGVSFIEAVNLVEQQIRESAAKVFEGLNDEQKKEFYQKLILDPQKKSKSNVVGLDGQPMSDEGDSQ